MTIYGEDAPPMGMDRTLRCDPARDEHHACSGELVALATEVTGSIVHLIFMLDRPLHIIYFGHKSCALLLGARNSLFETVFRKAHEVSYIAFRRRLPKRSGSLLNADPCVSQ